MNEDDVKVTDIFQSAHGYENDDDDLILAAKPPPPAPKNRSGLTMKFDFDSDSSS